MKNLLTVVQVKYGAVARTTLYHKMPPRKKQSGIKKLKALPIPELANKIEKTND